MSAVHHTIHTSHTFRPAPSHVAQSAAATVESTFSWAAQIRLGLALSAVAAIAAFGLAGRVAEPVIVVGDIVVASIAAWRRVEVAPRAVQPLRVHVRRR